MVKVFFFEFFLFILRASDEKRSEREPRKFLEERVESFPFTPLSHFFFPFLSPLFLPALSVPRTSRIMPCLMAAARAPAIAAQQCARGSSGAGASSSSLRASSMISPMISPRRFLRRSCSSSASLSVVAASTADRTFFVGGNWKSNCTKSSVKTLVKELNDAAKGQLGGLPPADQVEIVVGPEHIHLSMVLDSIDSRYGVSAQNCWTTSGGAYTGEVRE